jgi:arylsulfatase
VIPVTHFFLSTKLLVAIMKNVLILFLFCSIAALGQNTKPNIIIVYMDDMGYGDTEPYGMTGLPTPNFNILASQGLRLTNYNAAQAVCSASRAALLTGCYPNRVGIHGAILPQTKMALNSSESTIASLLKSNGYATAMLGKWHLGNKPPHFPMQFGFDSFYGLPYSHDMWPVDYAGKAVTDPANIRSTWPPLPVIEGDKQVSTIKNLEEQGAWTISLTERAVKYIDENKSKPFFLYIAHPLPHVPLATSKAFKGRSALGTFGDVVMELDWSLGKVMRAIDLAGIADNTILIVTSDNGPWIHFGDHAGSTSGFKEGKGTPFEGGTRVPFFIRWPGKIPAGMVSGTLMTNMDILPTICGITGTKLPSKKIDGVDFSSFLMGKSDKGPREVFYYYYGVNKLMAVRYKHWKLVLPHESQSYEKGTLGKDGIPGTLVADNKVTQALYDLSHDPGEEYDVQSLYPEVVSEIQKLAEQARVDLGDALLNRKGENVREAARVN